MIVTEVVGKKRPYTIMPNRLDYLMKDMPLAYLAMKVALSRGSDPTKSPNKHASRWVMTSPHLQAELDISHVTASKVIKRLVELGHFVETTPPEHINNKRMKCYDVYSDEQEGKLEQERRNGTVGEEHRSSRVADRDLREGDNLSGSEESNSEDEAPDRFSLEGRREADSDSGDSSADFTRTFTTFSAYSSRDGHPEEEQEIQSESYRGLSKDGSNDLRGRLRQFSKGASG